MVATARDTNPVRTDVVAAAVGGTVAYGRLVQRHAGLVCAIALAEVGDPQASGDLAQDVFLEAWRSLPTLRDPDRCSACVTGLPLRTGGPMGLAIALGTLWTTQLTWLPRIFGGASSSRADTPPLAGMLGMLIGTVAGACRAASARLRPPARAPCRRTAASGASGAPLRGQRHPPRRPPSPLQRCTTPRARDGGRARTRRSTGAASPEASCSAGVRARARSATRGGWALLLPVVRWERGVARGRR